VDADIERMVKEAEDHADEDQRRRQLVEAQNQADSIIHATEKNLSEYGDKVADADKSAIEDAIAALKEVTAGEDADAITSKTEALVQASMKLGEAIYKASQEEAASSAPEATVAPDDEESTTTDDPTVVDAEFEEVDPEEDQTDKDKKAS
jgi:molecular chaperone DnaK